MEINCYNALDMEFRRTLGAILIIQINIARRKVIYLGPTVIQSKDIAIEKNTTIERTRTNEMSMSRIWGVL